MDKEFFLSPDEFFRRSLPSGVTFDDITLATRYSEVLPRNVNLETTLSESIKLSIPIVSSDMDTVTESDMAIAMALSVRRLASSQSRRPPFGYGGLVFHFPNRAF